MLLLQDVHPHFLPMVMEALKAEFPGGPIELKKVSSDCQQEEQKGQGSFFTFSLPFAGTRIVWDVWFIVEQPDRSPDFMCVSEDFEYDHTIYMTVMKGWDFKDSFCLLNLLTKLNGTIYRTYQEEQMKKFPRIQETSKALTDGQISEYNIQACYLPQQKKYNFLIKLEVGDDDLPVPANLSSSQLYAGLLFSLATTGQIQSESLILSPYLEGLLGDLQGKMHVPSYSGTLVTPRFIIEFNKKLTEILEKIRHDQIRRRQIVASLLTLFHINNVSYDPIQYTEAVVHFKMNESRYIIVLNLLESEWDMTLFAIDRAVKMTCLVDEPVLYNETEKLTFTTNPFDQDFTKYFHEWLSEKVSKFVTNSIAINLPPCF